VGGKRKGFPDRLTISYKSNEVIKAALTLMENNIANPQGEGYSVIGKSSHA